MAIRQTLRIVAPVPDRAIPCSLLHRAMGADRYSAAQAVLHRNGWFYMIADDAWVYGWRPRIVYQPNRIEGRKRQISPRDIWMLV